MTKYLIRISRAAIGIFIYAFGLLLGIHANIGLAPWDAFSIGVSGVSGISYGNVSILTGVVILFLVVGWLKEKIGLGTVLNTILIGVFVDLLQSLNFIPYMNNFILGILMLLTGQMVISFATYFYISQGLGCGPRDTLMVGLGKMFPNIPIGLIRGVIEGTVLIIGWILGAKVGLGTVIAVFGMGSIMQMTFKLLHFEVRKVEHESIIQSLSSIKTQMINLNNEKSNTHPL